MTDNHAGHGFTTTQAAAMIAELERELGDRRRFYPGMIDKGRLDPLVATRQCDLLVDMLADLRRAFAPVMQRRTLAMPDRRFTWRDKLAELKRELAMRGRVYPDRIAKGRLDQPTATARTITLQNVLDLYWLKCLCWEPDGDQARAGFAEYVRRVEAGDALDTCHADHLAIRAELSAHITATMATPEQQQELGL